MLNWDLIRFEETNEIEAIRERMRIRQKIAIGAPPPDLPRHDLVRYSDDQPRDDHGRWTSEGGGDDGGPSQADQETSKAIGAAQDSKHSGDPGKTKADDEPPAKDVAASELFAEHNDPSVTAEGIVASVPGAAEAIENAEKGLSSKVETSSPVEKGGFLTAAGMYTDERRALHDKILREQIFSPEKVRAATPPEGTKPTMTVLGGRGGSGKSWFTGKNGPVDAEHAIYINSDDIQEHLPGYTGTNAALYHTEASDIAAIADSTVRSLGLNVIHDATMRTPGGTGKRVKEYQAAGYRIEGHYMFVPPQTSTKRAFERFVRGGKSGRYVPASYLLGSVTNEKTFDELRPEFDKWSIYQNMGKSPEFVAKGGK